MLDVMGQYNLWTSVVSVIPDDSDFDILLRIIG